MAKFAIQAMLQGVFPLRGKGCTKKGVTKTKPLGGTVRFEDYKTMIREVVV